MRIVLVMLVRKLRWAGLEEKAEQLEKELEQSAITDRVGPIQNNTDYLAGRGGCLFGGRFHDRSPRVLAFIAPSRARGAAPFAVAAFASDSRSRRKFLMKTAAVYAVVVRCNRRCVFLLRCVDG